MTTPFEEEIVLMPLGYDPFPQPQTIPAGWDVSTLYCEMEKVKDAEDLTEAESR